MMDKPVPANESGSPQERRAFFKTCFRINPIVAKLPDELIDQLAGIARVLDYAPGERIDSRGKEMHIAGVIVRGGIRNSLTSADGYELSMSILQKGAFYGVFGVPEAVESPWDCFAFGPTRLVSIYCSELRAMARREPQIGLLIAQLLNYRLRRAYAFMTSATLETLDNRLRRTLAMLVSNQTDGDQSKLAEIAITQETLGHFVQCTRPTVNKALKALEREGLVEVGYGTIRILNIRALVDGIDAEALQIV